MNDPHDCPDCQKAGDEFEELKHATWHNVCDGHTCALCPRASSCFAVLYTMPESQIDDFVERNYQVAEVLHSFQSDDFKMTPQILPICDSCHKQLDNVKFHKQELMLDNPKKTEKTIVAVSVMPNPHTQQDHKPTWKYEIDKLYDCLSWSVWDLIESMENDEVPEKEITRILQENLKADIKAHFDQNKKEESNDRKNE